MYVHYYAIIIILDENGLRSTILSFIAIISWTIYRPAKFVIVTGLREHMIVLQKKKKLWNVRINTTSFCFYLAFYLYTEIDFGVRMIRNVFSIDDDCVDGSKE